MFSSVNVGSDVIPSVGSRCPYRVKPGLVEMFSSPDSGFLPDERLLARKSGQDAARMPVIASSDGATAAAPRVSDARAAIAA